MASSQAKVGGKKIGRGLRKPAHARYVRRNVWLKNKLRKIARHIKSHPKDRVAVRALSVHGG